MSRKTFSKKVSDREKRKIKAGTQDKKVWFGLGMFGIVGWSIAVPSVAGAFLGIWMDSRYGGTCSWTLMLFMAGLCLGCSNAWYWIQKERREITSEKGKEK